MPLLRSAMLLLLRIVRGVVPQPGTLRSSLLPLQPYRAVPHSMTSLVAPLADQPREAHLLRGCNHIRIWRHTSRHMRLVNVARDAIAEFMRSVGALPLGLSRTGWRASATSAATAPCGLAAHRKPVLEAATSAAPTSAILEVTAHLRRLAARLCHIPASTSTSRHASSADKLPSAGWIAATHRSPAARCSRMLEAAVIATC